MIQRRCITNLVWPCLLAIPLAACNSKDRAADELGPQQPNTSLSQCLPAPADPLRRAYFGDLHQHTVYSIDSVATRLDPADAYRFARGDAVAIPPYAEDGSSLLPPYRIGRPLDFAAVTDHAESLGERVLCTDPELDTLAYQSPECQFYRQSADIGRTVFSGVGIWTSANPLLLPVLDPEQEGFLTEFEYQRPPYCGIGGEKCEDATRSVWQDIQLQAELFNDPGCFSSFVGYEYTLAPNADNLHRNVIFRNAQVPDFPVSVYEAPTPPDLWRLLDRHCTGDCEYLTIPHNSNLSNSRMFLGPDEDGYDAAARARAEPLIEVFQVKGDSECTREPGGSVDDPFCDFEKLPHTTFLHDVLGTSDIVGPPKPASYVRNGLLKGMQIERDTGVNPFRYGLIASTDGHFGLLGGVDENRFVGHRTNPPAAGIPDDLENNPGGLAVIWAEENTRDALFDAMQRKETYGTSGPRIQLRFFGGEGLPQNLCQQGGREFAASGYAAGVPMGGELHNLSQPPRFAVWAAADPIHARTTTALPYRWPTCRSSKAGWMMTETRMSSLLSSPLIAATALTGHWMHRLVPSAAVGRCSSVRCGRTQTLTPASRPSITPASSSSPPAAG